MRGGNGNKNGEHKTAQHGGRGVWVEASLGEGDIDKSCIIGTRRRRQGLDRESESRRGYDKKEERQEKGEVRLELKNHNGANWKT